MVEASDRFRRSEDRGSTGWSIRVYLVALSACFALLLVAAATILIHQAEAAGRAQTQEQLLDTTRALSQVVDSRLGGYERLLRAMSASDAVRQMDLGEIDRQARLAVPEQDAWVLLSDRSGRQLVNTRRPRGAALPTGVFSPGIWPELDAGRSRVCNLAKGVIEDHILCVDVPIMRNGRAEHVLSIIFRPRMLQSIISAQKIPNSRFAAILDRRGVVVWRNVNPGRFVGKPATPDMQRLLTSASEGVSMSHSLEGVPTVLAYSRSRDNGWTFIVAVQRSELGAAAQRALYNGGLVAALLIAVALLVALRGAERIRRDVAAITAGAQRIGAGEQPQFGRRSFSEFERLGHLIASAVQERDESRERFAMAQEVGGVGSWNWDSVHDEGHVSHTYREMHGLQDLRGPLRFSQVLDAIHPDDRAGYLERLQAATTRIEPSTNEYRVLHANGTIRWIAAKGRPIFDDAGHRIGSVGIVRDKTAEYEAEVALRRLNELLEQQVEQRTAERDRMWELARDPFVVADENGVWLEASPAWSSLLGYPVEAFIGRTSEWIEHPDDVVRTRAEDRRLAEGKITERFENRFRAKDGSYRWLSWNAVPEGNRFYSVARDITVEKEQAEALLKAEQSLRQAQKMESIGQITGGVAHDFNNLLVPIVGTLDILRNKGGLDARSERMIGNAIEAAERARVLVQRLLAFARRQPLTTQAVAVAECLNGMEPLLATTLGSRIYLKIETAPDLPPIQADKNQLELALLNLAVNAGDAMPDGGTLTISASVRDPAPDEDEVLTPDAYVAIQVVDTGAGMPPSVVERAFEPFFSTKGLGRGTGLGLSMVHGLMAQLGGSIRIRSEVGKGTTIELLLPIADQPAPSGEVPDRDTTAPFTGGRALVVDDEALVLASTADMVNGLGFDVVQAASASQALDILANQTFEFLITDHLMPGMTGTELARLTAERYPGMRTLIVSGYADLSDIAPDFDRLSKPFRAAELAKALGRSCPTIEAGMA
ncbi:PAS domain-containing protein [Novosphingobium sp. 9U]|uniref:PAS domain-containing protein n=1 Tax=Novosphingobium sp. 9U TaxID=2653158 RepID=UPI0012F16203|nr:PAS domain-containing protein [Novosphingobium sp. 9U]VWX49372.1 putative Histidine kinase [Novosphingobium sp. 9U]